MESDEQHIKERRGGEHLPAFQYRLLRVHVFFQHLFHLSGRLIALHVQEGLVVLHRNTFVIEYAVLGGMFRIHVYVLQPHQAVR